MEVYTDRIWTFSQNGEFTVREGQILLDDADVISDLRDARRRLYVTNGLEPKDLAVFLQFSGYHEGEVSRTTETIGYLVSKVTKDSVDGSGIIVSADKVEQDPKEWGNNRIYSGWNLLEKMHPGICNEFGLNGLHKYINSFNK